MRSSSKSMQKNIVRLKLLLEKGNRVFDTFGATILLQKLKSSTKPRTTIGLLLPMLTTLPMLGMSTLTMVMTIGTISQITIMFVV